MIPVVHMQLLFLIHETRYPLVTQAIAASRAPHLSLLQIIVLALLQGVTELFPISSLGHSVILPALLRWHIDQRAPSYLALVVLLHFGTAIALLTFYWRDWLRLIRALLSSLARGRFSDDPDERFIWMIIVGTVPAGVLAVLFQEALTANFGNARAAALLLIVNGVIMLLGERLRRGQERRVTERQESDGMTSIDNLGWRGALVIGLCQSLALLPGISRSGATMVGGLALGLRHHDAMRYTFMLATPIILAASVKTAPDLIAPGGRSILGSALLGMVLAGLAAYVSLRFLDRYFRTNRLSPFAVYCLVAGVGASALLAANL